MRRASARRMDFLFEFQTAKISKQKSRFAPLDLNTSLFAPRRDAPESLKETFRPGA
jgi:hypothetical protein